MILLIQVQQTSIGLVSLLQSIYEKILYAFITQIELLFEQAVCLYLIGTDVQDTSLDKCCNVLTKSFQYAS